MPLFDHQSGQHLAIDGAQIYYEVHGANDAPALLFLHGGFGTIEDFNSILPEIGDSYRIIGIDSQGQGKSTLGPGQLSYERIQKDVQEIIAHLGIDSFSIIGFSDGGIVAYRLAALTDLKIEKLVTIGARWHEKNNEATRPLLAGVTAQSWRNKFPETYESYQELNPEPDFERLTPSLVHMWLDAEPSGYANDSVKNISCALLIVRGDDDHLTSREEMVELAGIVQGSHLFNIPFAGHVAYEDQKELFLLGLKQFLPGE